MTLPAALRLPSVGTTIFTVMSKLAADVGAVNLSQGFPDFDCDPALVDAVARHMRAGLNQYAPMQGVPALRQAIAAKYAPLLRRQLRPRHRGDGDFRRHRGDLRRGRVRRASRRRGHRPGAVLRLLRPVHRAQRRRAGRRAAAPAGLPDRLGRGARGDHAAHAAADDQLAAQSHRLHPHRRRHRRADRDRRPHRHLHRQRRSLRAHHLRRRPPREHGAPSRARRPQLRRRLVRQDVSRDRVEGRLRGGAGGADGGAAQGAPVRHVQHAHAGPARASPSSWRHARASTSCRRSFSASATCFCG